MPPNMINPHIPEYMSKAPWYLNQPAGEGPKHQKQQLLKHYETLNKINQRGFTKRYKKKGIKKRGTANAARVSKGCQYDVWDGLSLKDPKRHPGQHITVTCVIYNTIAGGVPTDADVMAAVEDMERLYPNPH